MGMYFKDKTKVYKVRFTPTQDEYIRGLAEKYHCSKSEVVRIMINTLMNYKVTDHENK